MSPIYIFLQIFLDFKKNYMSNPNISKTFHLLKNVVKIKKDKILNSEMLALKIYYKLEASE